MHPTISSQLAQIRLADLRQHAQRDTLVRAARQAQARNRAGARPGRPDPGRRVLAVPGARIDGAVTSASTDPARLSLAGSTTKATG
jgi:hypothetical protein